MENFIYDYIFYLFLVLFVCEIFNVGCGWFLMIGR